MSDFKYWLKLQEDAFDRTIKQAFPTAPQWVRKDLFRDNWLKKQVKTGQSKTPFSDWLNNPQVQAFKNVSWPQQPQCVSIHPSQLADQTITDLIVRRFGKKPIKTRAFSQEQDIAKTDTQCRLMSAVPNACAHVPVIIVRQQDGKLRMVEGWHRFMCRLLDGCPENKKQLLYDQNYSNYKLWDALDTNSWQPVNINAFVGTETPPTNGTQLPAGQTPQNISYFSPTAPYSPATNNFGG